MDGVPHSWWSEDTRDKEVILAVKITGNVSSDIRIHRVHVRHSFSPNTTTCIESRGNYRIAQANRSQRSEYRNLGSSNERFDGMRNFRMPWRECLIDVFNQWNNWGDIHARCFICSESDHIMHSSCKYPLLQCIIKVRAFRIKSNFDLLVILFFIQLILLTNFTSL